MSADNDPSDDAPDLDPSDSEPEPAPETQTEPEHRLADRPAWRTPALIATRAVVVVVAAVVGYQLLIPVSHVDRNRLAHLVVTETGVAAFPGKAVQSKGQPVDQSGLKSLAAQGKRSPDKTGLWVAGWSGTGAQGASSGLNVVAFLSPSATDATQVSTELASLTLAAGSQTSHSFTRTQTFSVPDIAGSRGSLFADKAATSGQATKLAVVLFRQGSVLALVEGLGGDDVMTQTTAAARGEAAVVRTQAPGFTLTVVTHPVGATVAWVAVAVIVAVAVAGGPVVFGRSRRKRAARRQAELDALVPGHDAIVKRRRTVGS